MVPKLVRAVTQIKVAIISYHLQYFAVIVHNTKEHCGFGSALHPKKSHIIPRGVISPSLGTTGLQRATYLWLRYAHKVFTKLIIFLLLTFTPDDVWVSVLPNALMNENFTETHQFNSLSQIAIIRATNFLT